MRFRHLLALTALALCTAASCGAANAADISAANLLVNGDFLHWENVGWTQTGYDDHTSVSNDPANLYLFAGPGGEEHLTQTVAVQAKTSYQFSLSLQNLGSGPNDFSATFDGKTLVAVKNVEAFPATVYSGIFTTGEDQTKAVIQLSFMQVPSYWEVRNVSVSAVPLPAALPMFGAALAGLAGMGLRRRQKAA